MSSVSCPDLGLELKLISKHTAAHVSGFWFQRHSEMRNETALDWKGGFIPVAKLSRRIMLYESSVKLVLDVPSLMHAMERGEICFGNLLTFGFLLL